MPSKASQDGLLIVLDCGPNSSSNSKDGESFFTRAKNCVLRIFEQKIFGKSNDHIGVLLMGPNTLNHLYNPEDPECYKNLEEFLELKPATWESARKFDQMVKPCDVKADWFDALMLAMTLLEEKNNSYGYDKMKIVLMTEFATTMPIVLKDTKDKIVEKLKGKMELIVINDNIEYHQDFEHEDPQFSQSSQKSKDQESCEKLVMELIYRTDGLLCNLENAELQLVYFEKKKVTGRAYPYSLKIGTKISIEVAEYVKVSEPKYIDAWKEMHMTTGEEIKKSVKYYQNDTEIKVLPDVIPPAADENQTEPMQVNQAFVEIIKGYMYGATPVPCECDLKANFGEKSLTCIGFSDQKYVYSEHLTSKGCHVILPSAKHQSSPQKFAALVKALDEKNFVLIARKVYNRNSSPKIVALFPDFTREGFPFFTEIGMHFQEDCIDIKFPSLKKSKKFQPTQEQYDIIDQLITNMNLMTAGNEKTGNAEAFSLNKTLNPVKQHECRVIAYRALHPNEPVLQISEELKELIDVPKKIKEMSRDTLLKAKELFVLEEVKKQSKMQLLEERLKQITEKAVAAGDTSGLSERGTEQNLPVDSQIDKIGTVTPCEDFNFLINKAILSFREAARQMQEVLKKMTFQSFTVPHLKITKALVAYRTHAVSMGPQHYNDWIITYKEELFAKDKQDFFTQVIVGEEVGLILTSESDLSEITPEKGMEFYNTQGMIQTKTIIPTNDDDDDLMGMIE